MGVARVQAQNLLQMLNCTFGFAYSGFEISDNAQDERIVGVHVMSATRIGQRVGIAIQLATQDGAYTA